MKMSGNTVLITGGASGIGLSLAIEFRELGNTVLIAGRSKEKLMKAEALGFKTYSVDMTDATSIVTLAKTAIGDFPALNGVIQNAGIMKSENLLTGGNSAIQDETIATNLLGPMRLTEALLPHFLKQKSAAVFTVTSGLAFVPLNLNPTYCATKAGLHSYTESLRYQLRNTAVAVIEIAPPYVQTELTGSHQSVDPHAMPLKEYVAETMGILKSGEPLKEVLVKRVLPLRFAGDGGREKYEAFFLQFNDAMTANRAGKV